MKNIDSVKNRNEHKMWIYKNYFLPSQRFNLTVYDVTKTGLQKLDTLTSKYMKKWSGLPPCATNSIFHLRTGLEIKSISSLHEESHCVSHARTRLLGDSLVSHALTCKVSREAKQTRKHSVTVRAEQDYEHTVRLNTVGGDIPVFGQYWEREESEFNISNKKQVKTSCRIRSEEQQTEL